MSHQNSMSTRRSFIRKVKSVDINIPDADRIEGIVKSGELNRHGSIRRKIVPRPQDFANDSFFSDKSPSSPVKRTSTPNETFADLDLPEDSVVLSGQQHASPTVLVHGNSRAVIASSETWTTQIAPLEEETLTKIKDCLDSEKVRDIYTLGSRLQDLLTPAEIEEIVCNSHRYGDVISLDLVKALYAHHKGPAVMTSNVNAGEIGKLLLNRDPMANQAPPDLIDQDISTYIIVFFFLSFSFLFDISQPVNICFFKCLSMVTSEM